MDYPWLLLVVWIVPGTFYFVEPDEEGVVTRFGNFTAPLHRVCTSSIPLPLSMPQHPQFVRCEEQKSDSGLPKEGPYRRFPPNPLC